MSGLILTLNAGSSSVKFAAFAHEAAGLEALATGQIEGLGAKATFLAQSASGAKSDYAFDESHGRVDHRVAVGAILRWLGEARFDRDVVAVGHRIVHGGPDFAEPTRIDAALLARLRQFIPLAPLHQPHNLAGVEAALAAFPTTPQVACFDTAFHRTPPVRRGRLRAAALLSTTRACAVTAFTASPTNSSRGGCARSRPPSPPGASSSPIWATAPRCARCAAAVRSPRPWASPRSTACRWARAAASSIPGVVIYLMAEKGMNADAISDLLYKQSGLKGMSGLSHDMRVLEASDSAAARDAIAYFVARIRHEIGALASTLDGVDAIVFTAGIGENAWRVREAALTGMEWIGVRLDREANRANAQLVSAADSRVAVLVLHTDEERMIAEHTAATAGLPVHTASR